MYTLQVFYDGSHTPDDTHEVRAASDVLTLIPKLLQDHEGCERIVVSLSGTRMFAVDCKGNRLPD